MSVCVWIDWNGDGPDPEGCRPEHAQLVDVPHEGETLVAQDGSRWTVVGVEWVVDGGVTVCVRPEAG